MKRTDFASPVTVLTFDPEEVLPPIHLIAVRGRITIDFRNDLVDPECRLNVDDDILSLDPADARMLAQALIEKANEIDPPSAAPSAPAQPRGTRLYGPDFRSLKIGTRLYFRKNDDPAEGQYGAFEGLVENASETEIRIRSESSLHLTWVFPDRDGVLVTIPI